MKPLTLTLALTLAPMAALASENCGPTENVHAYLIDEFNEVPIAMGRTSDGYVFELWANLQTETWTYVLTADAGRSCIRDSGGGFIPALTATTGDPA